MTRCLTSIDAGGGEREKGRDGDPRGPAYYHRQLRAALYCATSMIVAHGQFTRLTSQKADFVQRAHGKQYTVHAGSRYSELALGPIRNVRALLVDIVRRLCALSLHLRHDEVGLLDDPEHISARETSEIVLVPATSEEDLELRDT
jgi:hypothetical protein